MPKSFRFLAVFLACLLCLMPRLAQADGVNSAKDKPLPMGASNSKFLYLTSTARAHFGEDVDAPLAWIDTNTGDANFSGEVKIENAAIVNGKVGSINDQDIGLAAAFPIWSNGFFVAPYSYFGRYDSTTFGLWKLNENKTLNPGKSLVLNNGKVGIGTISPSSLLSVVGNVYASDGAEANTLSVRNTAQEGSIDAARMDILTRLSSLKCSEGQLLTKDTNETFKCVTVAYNGTFNCPAGEALTGFVNGVPQCSKPPAAETCRPVVDCVGREPEPGDMCQDGTVFVGYTPDGHVKMFATPCFGYEDYYSWYGWDGCSRCNDSCVLEWCPYEKNSEGYLAAVLGRIGANSSISGKSNTALISSLDQTSFTSHQDCYKPAAVYCDDLVAYGHSDWYLPSMMEAKLFENSSISYWDVYAYRNKKTGKLPLHTMVWTSTESPEESNTRALMYYENDGSISVNGSYKLREYYAHCVRKEGCREKVDCINGDPSPGDMCLDGTVYAGLSPDGNVKMYTTPCDLGQTWDGCSTCTGNRTLAAWSGGPTSTGITNPNTGKANSAALSAMGSYYEAARRCENLVANGYSDWYLPAINELMQICYNSMSIGSYDYSWGGDALASYWSSTEKDYNTVYDIQLSNSYPQCERVTETGILSTMIKYNVYLGATTRNLRCVRR